MYKMGKGTEKVLGVVPFFHVYGLTAVLNLSMKMGYEMILLPKFDPQATLRTIDKQKPTLFPGRRQSISGSCIIPIYSVMICLPLKAV